MNKEQTKEQYAFKGSIRVEATSFKKATEPKWIDISFKSKTKGEMKGLIKYASIMTEDVKAIFEEAKINWLPIKGEGEGYTTTIKGLDFEKIEDADKGHARIRFGGITASEFEDKKKNIIKWLRENSIDYGEKDGGESCVWFCPKRGRQSELVGDLLTKLDELRGK